jgi:hypothetical protein
VQVIRDAVTNLKADGPREKEKLINKNQVINNTIYKNKIKNKNKKLKFNLI